MLFETEMKIFEKLSGKHRGFQKFSSSRINGRFQIPASQPETPVPDLRQARLVQSNDKRFDFILRPRLRRRRPFEPQRTVGRFLSRPLATR